MPKARIDGTHNPINMAFSFSPEKNNISENIKLERADINNNMSVMLKFLNMYFLFVCIIKIN
jgi:hypothetical protein|tara:strand:- start:98 stop:283 length:186 start_codon:yes stop_codon:yes gene_type:complete